MMHESTEILLFGSIPRSSHANIHGPRCKNAPVHWFMILSHQRWYRSIVIHPCTSIYLFHLSLKRWLAGTSININYLAFGRFILKVYLDSHICVSNYRMQKQIIFLSYWYCSHSKQCLWLKLISIYIYNLFYSISRSISHHMSCALAAAVAATRAFPLGHALRLAICFALNAFTAHLLLDRLKRGFI